MRLITWWCIVMRSTIHLANRYDSSITQTLCGLSLERMVELRNPRFIALGRKGGASKSIAKSKASAANMAKAREKRWPKKQSRLARRLAVK